MNGIRSSVPPALRTLAMLLMVLMVGVGILSAQTTAKAPAKKKTSKVAAKSAAPATTANAGQKIFVDPVTHQIVPATAEDNQALDNAAPKVSAKKALAKTADEPQEFVTDGGFFGVVVPEENMAYAVATTTADGKVKTGCVDGKKKAEAAVRQPVSSQTVVLDEK